MKGYAWSESFSEGEKKLFERVTKLVAKVPYKLDGEYVRCHELARAVAAVVGFDEKAHVADGYYGMIEHSWLWTTPRVKFARLPNVIEVYSVGKAPIVQLVDMSPQLPLEYRLGARRRDIRKAVVRELVRRMGGA